MYHHPISYRTGVNLHVLLFVVYSTSSYWATNLCPQIWQGKEMSEVEMRMWALKLEEAELLTYLLPLPRCDLDKPIQETHLTD